MVFLGDQWEALLSAIPQRDCVGFCTIIKSDGQVIRFSRTDGYSYRYPESYTSPYPSDLLWTQGAELWKFQQDCYDRGTLNANFRKILSDSSRLGVLVPQTAYIVVETEAQRKMLAVKQAEAANANLALGFDYDSKTTPTDAPTLLALALGFAAFLFLRRHCRFL